MTGLRNVLLALAILVAAATGARAYTDDGNVYIFNKTTCGQYVSDRKLPEGVGFNRDDRVYVAGWLTAFNTYVPGGNVSGDGTLDSVMRWLDEYCAQKLFSTMQQGLLALSKEWRQSGAAEKPLR